MISRPALKIANRFRFPWSVMPRSRNRACLQEGLKLDLNRLRRQRFVCPGLRTGPNRIRWSNTYTEEEVACGLLSASLEHVSEGWLRIQIGRLDQWIPLRRQPRHFGGGQWYFECVKTGQLCSAVWMPPARGHSRADRLGVAKLRTAPSFKLGTTVPLLRARGSAPSSADRTGQVTTVTIRPNRSGCVGERTTKFWSGKSQGLRIPTIGSSTSPLNSSSCVKLSREPPDAGPPIVRS